MKINNYIKTTLVLLFSSIVFTSSAICIDRVSAATQAPVKPPVNSSVQQVQAINVAPLELVKSPKQYLNKTVIMNADFDKFSTLGLDYKPAFKSSEEYISFLIKRDDTSFDIPLSEMKLFLKRDKAEKFIDLKTNDKIEIKGVVFSDALDDVWVDVKELKVTQKAPEENNNKK